MGDYRIRIQIRRRGEGYWFNDMEFKSEECGITPEDVAGMIGADVTEWVEACIEADKEREEYDSVEN